MRVGIGCGAGVRWRAVSLAVMIGALGLEGTGEKKLRVEGGNPDAYFANCKLPRSGRCLGVAAMCTIVYTFREESQYKN